MRDVVKYCSLIGTLCSILVIACYSEVKHRLLRCLCFTLMLMSGSAFIFLVVDDNVPQTCVDRSRFYIRQPLCVLQALIFAGGSVTLVAFETCIALHLWAAVVLKVSAFVVTQRYVP
jgi:hypothetical protein